MTEHLAECWATYPSDPAAWCICDELRACEQRHLVKMIGLGILQTRADELRACEERVTRAFKQQRSEDSKWSYAKGFDDARWLAAKEALEAVQHEEPCDCEPCKAIVRALAELRTIGNDS